MSQIAASPGEIGFGQRSGKVRAKEKMSGRTMRVLVFLLSILSMLLVWQLAASIAGGNAYTLPAPASVFSSLWKEKSVLLPAMGATAEEAALGFLIAAGTGVLLACVIASSKLVERLTYPALVVTNAVPKIALAPIFIAWFGLGSLPRIFIAALLAVFPIVISTVVGLVGVDEGLILVARSTNARRRRVFWLVRLPAALPSIMGGLKVGVTLAVTGAVVGEFVGGNTGLGYIILQAQGNLQMSLAFAAVVALGAAGVAFFYLVEAAERLVVRRR